MKTIPAHLQALYESDLSVMANRLILADALEDEGGYGNQLDAAMARDPEIHVACYRYDRPFLVNLLNCQRRYFAKYAGEPGLGRYLVGIVPYFMAKRFIEAFGKDHFTPSSRTWFYSRFSRYKECTRSGADYYAEKLVVKTVADLYKAEGRS